MENDWLDRTEYPFASNYFNVHGHRLHYIDEGQGDIILFVHGTPSWSFDFRNVIKDLRANFRCIAIDHMGFGLSDKPEDYDYSTQNHGLTLEAFVLEKKFRRITLVVHDFGGPIAISLAIRQPNLVKNLIILNSWLWSAEKDPDFTRRRKILESPLLPFLYRYLNFSPKFLLPRSFGSRKLPKHLLAQYTKPFANKSQRNGTVAFARSLLHDQDWFQHLWDTRAAISAKPVLFIWGMKDPIIKAEYLDKFVSGFSNAQVVKLETCGHFPQEEHPDIVALSIRYYTAMKPAREAGRTTNCIYRL